MSAIISDDGLYRYRLDRHLGQCDDLVLPSGRLCWVMFNPSTADAELDDPTIRRVKRFTLDNGYSDLTVVNLYGFRATNPIDLQRALDPIGPENDRHVEEAFRCASSVVFAWGASSPLGCKSTLYSGRRRMTELARARNKQPLCLGTTKDGHPRHPLHVRADQPLVEYR